MKEGTNPVFRKKSARVVPVGMIRRNECIERANEAFW